jgi:N-acetylmuramoyl-L-alanine amidase
MMLARMARTVDPATGTPRRVKFLGTHNNRKVRRSRWLTLGVTIGIVLLVAPRVGRSDNFVFYFPKSHSVLSIRNYGNVEYLPFLRLLNLFGQVGSLKSKRKSLEVWFNSTHIRLRQDNPNVRLNNSRLKLGQPVRFIAGEWMVPVEFVTTILPTLINQTVEYQRGENRMFVGGIKPNSFTLHLSQLQEGAQITIQFSDPVNLRTAAQNGKWILYLGSSPIEPIESNFQFQNPYVSQVKFDDQDGQPKLIITPSAPGFDFYPKLGEGKKILLANIVKPGATMANQTPALPAPSQQARPSQPAPPAANPDQMMTPAPVPNLSLPAVVLDAGHGGTDTGAQGKNGLLEKNLTMQLVAQVQRALQATGRYRVVLTRNGDVNVGFDQRAAEANIARPVAFVSFHAGDLGPATPRVMVYSYRPSSPLAMAPGSDTNSLFVNWNKVQLRYMDQSNRLAHTLQQDLQRTTRVASTPPMEVPVRVLQSIAAPAVAIEVGSLTPSIDSSALTNQSFQQEIGTAVVEAVASLQGGQK